MFRNYLTIAIRNLLRQKGFSIINILGLSVGMACAILIFLWVIHELSYNRFNEKADRLFRLVQTQHYTTGPLTTTCMPGLIAGDLREEIPEVINSFMYYEITGIVSYKDQVFEEKIRLADSCLWDMFTFTYLKGDPDRYFSDLNSAVLTDKIATKYFGHEDPVGKVITINNEHSFRVSGVIKDPPLNSTFRFDFCIPFRVIDRFGYNTRDYGWNTYYCYVELPPETDYYAVNVKIRDFLMKKANDPETQTDTTEIAPVELFLFPLTKLHLHSVTGHGGDIQYVYIFSAIALFILVIACINFMNLTTARAMRRSREVGLRKVAGADRKKLVYQFISESMLITSLAFLVALLLVRILLPSFNVLADKTLSIDWSNGILIAGMIGIVLFVGILAGSYPSLHLSRFDPVEVLKNLPVKGKGGSRFRQVLVVFQFSLSTVMIIATIVVYRQLAYIHTKKLGMELENVVITSMRGRSAANYEAYKTALLSNPSIQSVSRSNALPFAIGSNSSGFRWEGKDSNQEILIGFGFADVNFDETVGIQMELGRFFEGSYATDSTSAIVVNQSAARVMGMDDPIGKWIRWSDDRYTVIGVMEDFHFLPMSYEISPLVLINRADYCNVLFAKISRTGISQTIDFMRDAWEKTNPGFPFEYQMLKDVYSEMYASENRLSSIFSYFAVLSIFISCLGLFGLAAFMAEQRTKEIGVRKVLGASLNSLMYMLVSYFVKLVLIANIIAIPVAWYLMSEWLGSYVYHTRLTAGLFISVFVLSLLIATGTVSFQTLRASTRNPINALKYE